jgi:hypothetical protein
LSSAMMDFSNFRQGLHIQQQHDIRQKC